MAKEVQNRVVVIGGGISGLASAALLAKQGWQVTLLEKNATLGGRARVWRYKGFSFDMGPSWYLMPEIFDSFFTQLGRKTSDLYSLKRLNPRYDVFYSDSTKARFTDNIDETATWFESVEKGAGSALRLYLARMEKLYQAALILLNEDIWSITSVIKPSTCRALSTLITSVHIHKHWYAEINRYVTNHKLIQALSFPAVFLGGSPFTTPSFYSLLNWADYGRGVWYPRGGMGRVVHSIAKIANELGVEIKTKAEVTDIVVEKGVVKGVRAKGMFYEASKVVAATDIPWVETTLLPKEYKVSRKKWQEKQVGISAILLYLGVNKRIGNIAHHSLYFTSDWQKSFDSLLNKMHIPADPSFYVSARSVSDETIAPKGQSELFVLIPVGAKTGYTKDEITAVTEHVLAKVEGMFATSIAQHLVVKKIYTPADFARDYHAFNGTALGLAHTFGQSLWFRPRTEHPTIQGLYYCGQYTDPGVGVPMALVSAQKVARRVGVPRSRAAQIFKKGSVTYYYASVFFRGQVKKDVFTLYAYVRCIDDLVDRQKADVRTLEQWWRETVRGWRGQSIPTPEIAEFISLAKRKGFKWTWIQSFWQAMRQDLTKTNYKNYSELEAYMVGSAEVIGLMMARILDLPEAANRTAALQGKAMQLLNFIRDVHEDAELGRNYLGFNEADKRTAHTWQRFVRSYIERYRKLQAEAEKGYTYIPKRYLVPIKSAADMYLWTAEQIYRQPNIVWKTKVKPTKVRVVTQVLRNWITTT